MTKTSTAPPPELKTLEEVIEYLEGGERPVPRSVNTLRLGNVKLWAKGCRFAQANDAIDQALKPGRFAWETANSPRQLYAIEALRKIGYFEGIASAKDELQVLVRLANAIGYMAEAEWLEEYVLPNVS